MPTGLNADGIVVSGSAGNQIGPGNTIAHATDDGVLIGSTDSVTATGNRIVANSIFDSGNLGIELQDANDNIAAPVITSVSGGTVSGTFTSLNPNPVFVELFVNPTCDAPFASGAGQTFVTFVSVSPGPWSCADRRARERGGRHRHRHRPGHERHVGVLQLLHRRRQLALRQRRQSIVKPVDLTAAGNSDWALWGHNSSGDQPASALTPNETEGERWAADQRPEHRQRQTARLRAASAASPTSIVPFNFSWTDGRPTSAVSGGHAGLTRSPSSARACRSRSQPTPRLGR